MGLHIAQPSFPKSVEVLAGWTENAASSASTEEEKPFKIFFHPKDYESLSFMGRIEIFNDGAHITYDRRLNACWRRFVITKEICHILLFDHEAMTGTPQEVEQLIVEIMAGLPMFTANEGANCDSYTMLMALEILLPHHQREKNNGKPAIEIARLYRVPEAWVRVYLSNWYKTLMDDCYAQEQVEAKAIA